MLPRVEALVAGRARLEAVNALQHDFREARGALLQHNLLQAEQSKRMLEAAYIDLQASGDGRRFAELQESDFEDLTTSVDVLAAENTEFQIKVKEVDAGAEHSEITRDLEAELRKLKQAYEAVCSEKDNEASALTAEKDFVSDQFKTLKRDYADLLSYSNKKAARATEAAQELQQNIKQLQVVSQKKDDEIRRLRAQANAKAAEAKRKFVPEGKLQKIDCMPKEIDTETEKCKDRQPETSQKHKKDMGETHKKGCSEGPALRVESKDYSSKQTLAEDGQPETNQKRKFAAFLSDGEELAFDNNAPQKCFYGTTRCRGYIGGDISGSGIIAQDDSESEQFEPMVTYKDPEEMLGNTYCSHGANPNIVEHETSTQHEDSNNCPPATPGSEPHQQTSPILSYTSEPDNSMEAWSPQDAEQVTRTPVHVSRTIDSSLQQVPVYGTQQKIPNTIDELRAPNVMNRSTPSSDLGSSLVPGFHATKNSVKHHRNVKPPGLIDNKHTLGVEGRLNSLLDQGGGISSREDSTNEYLRLLFVTAAGGDTGGTPIRDIALILEALLQTKSGDVLLYIINMNGLQMLHNILKQNRDQFIRRPIIRKLLKVLEFLALRGILTAEKINETPRCVGIESFRDSILKLTRHSDKQVQGIAKTFCDKWILPYMVGGPANCSTPSYPSRRKRKSRWDH